MGVRATDETAESLTDWGLVREAIEKTCPEILPGREAGNRT